MKRDLTLEDKHFRQLVRMAQIGWWEANFTRKEYFCSDFVADLLGVPETRTLSFRDFKDLIREDHRTRITNEFSSILLQDVYEQTFPITTQYGTRWVHSKMGVKERNEAGELTAMGFLQIVPDPDINSDETNRALQRRNDLLFQQNAISGSLFSFLKSRNTGPVIHKILSDIQQQFEGSRVYIVEYDWKKGIQKCIHEVISPGLESKKRFLNALSIDQLPWLTEQIISGSQIILHTPNDLPEEAAAEREILKKQKTKSLMVIPLWNKEKAWGYFGIDMVRNYYHWTNEDYQWFASLANITNICLELRKEEKKVQVEKRDLEDLFKHMPLGYIRARIERDKQGHPVNLVIMSVNLMAEEISGINRRTAIGKRLSELGIDEKRYLPKILETVGTSLHVEMRFHTTLTDRDCHAVFYSPSPNEAVALFSDITEILKTHEKLDRSEKTLRNIYQNIPIGLELYDAKGILIDMNDKDMEIFGLKDKKAGLGLNIYDNPNLSDEIKEKIRRGESVDFQTRYDFSAAKEYFPSQFGQKEVKELIAKITPIFDSENKLINYLLLVIDNTRNNTIFNRIKEFETFFSLIADSAKVGYAKWDINTKDGAGLGQWFKNMGYPEDADIAHVVRNFEFMHPDDREAIFSFYHHLDNGKAHQLEKQVRIVRPEEPDRWIQLNLLLTVDPETNRKSIICINFDITELIEVEHKLIEAKNKAETMDRLKSAFLANMSHEIRTPLNAIVGFSSLLLETTDPMERRKFISIVQENNELLLQLISDILDLSKIEAGTFEFTEEETNIGQLCNEIVTALRLKEPENVTLRLEKELPDYRIVCDKNRIYQILSNFINNAFKFTKRGSVTLGYERRGAEIRFSVEDTGIGIPTEEIGNIFDRFVKLNSFVHGTGLGLAISKSLVEQMGGRIGVESKVGKGSCFWFSLPYIAATNGPARSKVKTETFIRSFQTERNKRPVILIAEDTESNYLLVSAILGKEYQLLRARTGEEAVNIATACYPDLILMDIRMPEMDGLEATRIIRQRDKKTPIIAVTAFAFDRDKQHALDAGCNDYLSKPLSGQELKKLLGKYL